MPQEPLPLEPAGLQGALRVFARWLAGFPLREWVELPGLPLRQAGSARPEWPVQMRLVQSKALEPGALVGPPWPLCWTAATEPVR